MKKMKPLIILGVILLASQAGVSWLSQFFIFGQGHAERPILTFLVLEVFGFATYFLAVEWMRKRPPEEKMPVFSLAWILFIGIFCRLVFLPSQLIQETDPYRYVWDGQTVLQGENPYKNSPQEAFGNKQIPVEVPHEEAIQTFQRINHAGIKTIYPPLAQYLFTLSQKLSPWSLSGWRGMIFLAEGVIFALVLGFLPKLGIKREWLILYAWCPLIIKEFSNSLHVDVFAVLFLSSMVFAISFQRFKLAFLSLGLAAGVKLFPLMLAPLFFIWVWRLHRKAAVQGLVILFLSLAFLYTPFLSAGRFLFEGLGRFAGEWQVNAGLFGLIQSRIVSFLLFVACVYGAITWLARKYTEIDFFRACLFVICTLFFLVPACNPWYFTWVFPFLYFLPLRSLVIFAGLVFFYYLDFYLAYRSESHLFLWVRWAEYGIFYFLLGGELWMMSRKSQLFCQLQTSKNLLPTR